jgi:hypothetical protein
LSFSAAALHCPDHPPRRDVKGLAMTGWHDYAPKLAEKFAYQNTFHDQKARLDISNPKVPPVLFESQGFIISSDAVEHGSPLISQALESVSRIIPSSMETGPHLYLLRG